MHCAHLGMNDSIANSHSEMQHVETERREMKHENYNSSNRLNILKDQIRTVTYQRLSLINRNNWRVITDYVITCVTIILA